MLSAATSKNQRGKRKTHARRSSRRCVCLVDPSLDFVQICYEFLSPFNGRICKDQRLRHWSFGRGLVVEEGSVEGPRARGERGGWERRGEEGTAKKEGTRNIEQRS